MPNHIKNVWKIKNIPPDKINYLLNKLTIVYTRSYDMMLDEQEHIIDFDLIIPEPRFKADCPKRYQIDKDCHIKGETDREWFHWYKWRCENWGTKWNAYDGYTKIGKTQITFVFNTAWSFPDPIVSKLSMLGYDLDIKYADESIGNNCGKITYNAKDNKWNTQTEIHLSNPKEFAEYLWLHY